jgi:hypothetical protein
VSHERPDDPAVRVPPTPPDRTAQAEQIEQPDIDAIMGRLSDLRRCYCANALVGSQEREGSSAGADVGDEISTLVHGVQCVCKAYDALDVAVRELREFPRDR